MIELAKERGERLQEEAREELPKLQEDAQPAIYSYIMRWFLLKKFCYVQYMMDKRKLQEEYEGNVKTVSYPHLLHEIRCAEVLSGGWQLDRDPPERYGAEVQILFLHQGRFPGKRA